MRYAWVIWIVTYLVSFAAPLVLFMLLCKMPDTREADYGVEGSFVECFKLLKIKCEKGVSPFAHLNIDTRRSRLICGPV